MDTFSKKFRAWMDERRLKASDVAAALHIEPQTVRNWRASGIPKRRHSLVASYMEEFDRSDTSDPVDVLRSRPLIVDATPDQFRRWEGAALAAGKTLTQWAIDSLEQLAEEQGYAEIPPSDLAIVAEPGKPYRPHSSSGDADPASDTALPPCMNEDKIA